MRCCRKAMFRTAITGTLAVVPLAMGLILSPPRPPDAQTFRGLRRVLSSRSRGEERLNSGQAPLCWSRTGTAPLMGSSGSGE